MILIAQNESEFEALKAFTREKNLKAWVIPVYEPRFVQDLWHTSPFAQPLFSLVAEINAFENPKELPEADEIETELCRRGLKIEAIKAYRARVKSSLAEAKGVMDKVYAEVSRYVN